MVVSPFCLLAAASAGFDTHVNGANDRRPRRMVGGWLEQWLLKA